MPARLLLNVLMTTAVAGLAAWLWLPAQPVPGNQTIALISMIDPASIDHILLIRPGKPDLALQRSGTKWLITSPVSAIASPFRINSLLSLLQARSISTVDAPLETFGLAEKDNPVTLTFNSYRFRLGDVNPLDQGRYIEYAGTIHIIDDTLYPQLLQDAGFFIDTSTIAPATVQPAQEN